MRLCRYNDNRIGIVRGGVVHDVTAIVDELRAGPRLIAILNADSAADIFRACAAERRAAQ